jgi:uncharacterized protein YrzB (UPF0473 family)
MMDNHPTENDIFEETDIIETTDEEGQVHIFEKISDLEIDGQEYALLIYKGNSVEEEDDAKAQEEGYEEEVVVMKISYEDGQEVYEAIEDEDEFNRVVAYIDTLEDEDGAAAIDVEDFLTNLKDEGPKDVSKN